MSALAILCIFFGVVLLLYLAFRYWMWKSGAGE